jgi:hypothetical protein
MAFAGSGFFTSTLVDILNNTTAMDWEDDTYYIALFNDTATPDFTVASASTAYGVGVWASNEVSGTGWAAGGVALTTGATGLTGESPAAGQVKIDAADVSETGTTLVSAEGCLIYNFSLATPVDNQGVIVVDFGAPYSTTNGTFAVTWDANGVAYFDVW